MPDRLVMIIDPDDDAFRQEFDAWPAHLDTSDGVFAVTTRYFDFDYPRLRTNLLNLTTLAKFFKIGQIYA